MTTSTRLLNILSCTVLLVLASVQTRAFCPPADDAAETPNLMERNVKLCYGISYNIIGAIATNPAGAHKTGPGFTTENAFQLFIPFDAKANSGFGLEFGSSAMTYTTQYTGRGDTTFKASTETYSYTSLFPHFYINGFVIGAQVALSPTAIIDSTYKWPVTLSPKTKTAIIPRIGASIPLANESWGRLNFNFIAGYAFSGLYDKKEDYPYQSPNINESDYEAPIPVTLSLGITFLFRVPIFY